MEEKRIDEAAESTENAAAEEQDEGLPSLDTPISTEDPGMVPDDEPAPRRQQSSPFMLLRVLAGGYLIYLSYSMIKSMNQEGDRKWYIYLFAALFIAAGAAIILFTIRNYLAASKADKEAAEEEAARAERQARIRAEKARAEGKPALDSAKSITERLRMLNEAEGVEVEEIGPEPAEADPGAERSDEAENEDPV